MGMFDSVYVPCPHCGKDVEFQSKEGECCMFRYRLDTAPAEILWDIINHPEYCMSCGRWFALIDPAHPPTAERPKPNLRALGVRTPANPSKHRQGFQWWPDDEPFSFADLDESPL